MKPKVICIIGPTAVGKTELGIRLCKQFDGEVINGDSMQVFREFNIGTAKATKSEQDGIPHHLIDILDPQDKYSAAHFKADVQKAVAEITSRGKLPVIVGGTGFYVQAAIYDFNFSDISRDPQFEKRMQEKIDSFGLESLYEYLKQVDPVQAEKIHPHNERRLIRALEVYEMTGKPLSEYEATQEKTSPYTPFLVGLNMDRAILYDRINKRVVQMADQGLFEEVKSLYRKYGSDIQPMQGIGYKEVIPYINGVYDRQEAINQIQQNTRRFAKRQLTFYRNRLKDIHWFDLNPESIEEFFSRISSKVEGFIENG